jgi:hypothetical protein
VAEQSLEFLKHLLAEHRTDAEEPRLVSCVHFDATIDAALLKAFAERVDGQLFDLSSEKDWEPPAGPIADHRRDIALGVVAASPLSVPGDVEVTMVDSHVVATIPSHAGKIEPSLALVLRAIALISSAAYDQSSFAVVIAPIATVDAPRRELLWKLLGIDPRDLGLARGTTLVTVVSGPLSPDPDYVRVPSIRLVVRPDRVLARSPHRLQTLLKLIADSSGPVVLFLGAGASQSSGMQLGNSYRDLAIRAVLGLDASSPLHEPGVAFFDYLRDVNRYIGEESRDRDKFVRSLTLERVLRETFHQLGFAPRSGTSVIKQITEDATRALAFMKPGRRALHAISDSLRGRLLIATVNFDQIVEDQMATAHKVYFRADDFRTAAGEVAQYVEKPDEFPLPILKLHGSIEDPDTLIANIDETSAGLDDSARGVLDSLLSLGDGPLTWIWVGCSMRDKDINAWLSGLGREALDEWWVDPLPSSSLDEFFAERREAVWSARGMHLVDRLVVESADHFYVKLAETLGVPY